MKIIVISIIASIAGTCLGSMLAILIGKRSPRSMTYLLAFAGGIILSLVFLGIIPEALELSDLKMTVLGISIGIVIIIALDAITDRMTKNAEVKRINNEANDNDNDNAIQNRPAILRSGIVMLIAIGIHNIPVGLAMGVGASHDVRLGGLLALMFVLHNIPEGMAITAPLLASGIKKGHVILLSALSGVPTIIGAIIGIWIGGISEVIMAITLSGVAGLLLFIIFGEVIPRFLIVEKSRTVTIIALLGIMVGLVLAV
ncbi:hypothetical protein FACS189494_10540 [Spirochaetia bacterium]|nr:hypothetical protein FACS189494_10540 [Spirochaetia bacterium]